MRIAVNADYLAAPLTGIGRYLTQLTEAMGMVDGVNDYALLTSRPIIQRPSLPSTFTIEEVPVTKPSERLRKLRWEQYTFPEAARKRDAKMVFVPHFAPPVRSSLPVIVTIHDMLPFALPEYRPLSAAQWLYQQVVAKGAQSASRIITVSDFAKSEIIRYLDVREEQITVIPNAPAAQFRPVTDANRLREAQRTYHLGDRYIAYVGGFDMRKNVPLLIGAFAAMLNRTGDPTLKLLLSGDPTPLGTSPLYPDWRMLPRKFGIEGRVINTLVSEADLPAIYSAATAFVYPSMYEGFGLPPVEAMACGAPVIISDHPALREVADAAALTFPLAHEDGVAIAATRALAEQLTRLVQSPELRVEYHERGLARAQHFSWAQAAGETSGIFADVGGMRT